MALNNNNLPVSLVKISSDRGGPWNATSTSREIDFYIPASNGFVDLDQTLLLLKMNLTTTAEADVSLAIRPAAIGYSETKPKYSPSVLIRNAYIECERIGRLDTATNVNIRNPILDSVSKSGQDWQSATQYDGTFETDESSINRSIFRDLRYLDSSGDSFSSYSLTTGVNGRTPVLTPNVIIKLSDIFNLFKGQRQYPLMDLGEHHIHLEVVDSTQTVTMTDEHPDEFYMRGMDVSSSDARNSATLAYHIDEPRDLPMYGGEPIVITGSYDTSGEVTSVQLYTLPPDFTATPGDYEVSGAQISTTGSGTGAVFTITVTDNGVYNTNLVDLTVDNGGGGYQPDDVLIVPGTHWGSDASLYIETVEVGTAGADVSFTSWITGLQHNYGNERGAVRVTWNDPITASGAGVMFNNVRVEMASTSIAPTWEIQEANVVLPVITPSKQMLDGYMKQKSQGYDINYTVWDTISKNQDAGNRFDTQIVLPPLCDTFIASCPRTTLFPNRNNIDKFRFRLNGIDTTEIDIEDKTPFYYDRILETWKNMGVDVKNLDVQYRPETLTAYEGYEAMVLAQPVPLMPEQSQLDLEIYGTNMTQGNLEAFMRKQRTIRIDNNGAQLMN